MKHKMTLMFGVMSITALWVPAAIANDYIDESNQTFTAACGYYPTNACAQDFWSNRSSQLHDIATTMAAMIDTPGFQSWCSSEPEMCDGYYAELSEVGEAWAHAVTNYQLW